MSRRPEWVIQVASLGKQYLVTHEKSALVRGLLPHLLRPRHITPFWALRHISFEIPPGQCVGVMGPNGAGKSTLLALLAGITAPSMGRVAVRGRVAPIMFLGAGFHPELTGEENLWLNGALLGMPNVQLRQVFQQIADFAGLNGFLDAPLATYSTGMQMRLAFAIAIHAQADIILIDEVMAVGDQAFQAKCLERLQSLKQGGKTLLIVAHSAGAFKTLADRALLLHQGQLIADGTVDHVHQRYSALTQWLAPTQQALSADATQTMQRLLERQDPVVISKGWGQRRDGATEIEDVQFLNAQGQAVDAVATGEGLTVSIRFVVTQPMPDPHLGVAIFHSDGVYCYGPNTRCDGLQFSLLEAGTYTCHLHFDALTLTPGVYRLSVAIWDTKEESAYATHHASYPLRITGAPQSGVMTLTHQWSEVSTSLARSQDEVSVKGPLGEQAWFRTFEPLTITIPLGSHAGQSGAVLRAECRGQNQELVWASTWNVPIRARADEGQRRTAQLVFPQLPLLTGRYEWSFHWDGVQELQGSDEPLACLVDVIADRFDHGILYLPHHWQVQTCQAIPTTVSLAFP